MRRLVIQTSSALALLVGVDLLLRWSTWAAELGGLWVTKGAIKVIGAVIILLMLEWLALAALLSGRVGRWILVALMPMAVLIARGYLEVVQRYPSSTDLRISLGVPVGMATGAITSFAGWHLVSALIIGAMLAAALWKLSIEPPKLGPRVGIAVVAAILIVPAGMAWMTIRAERLPLDPFGHLLRSSSAFAAEEWRFARIDRERLEPTSARATDNVVLILSESVRSDQTTLFDPELDTTPYLAEWVASHPRQAIDLGTAVAISTCSMVAKIALFTGLDALPDRELECRRRPTLFDRARAAGYRPVVIDAPGTNLPNAIIRAQDLEGVELLKPRDLAGESPWVDLRAASWLREHLAAERGLFVVVIKRGVHFHYEDAYPPEARWRRFGPTLQAGESYGADRERMIASYRSAIAFNVDGFFEEFLKVGLPESTTVLWTSDHGQSLQEHGELATHCGRRLEMVPVPLVVLSTRPGVIDGLRPLQASGILASHYSLHPTLVDLIGAESQSRWPSLFELDEQTSLEWAGPDLFGGHHALTTPGELASFIGPGQFPATEVAER